MALDEPTDTDTTLDVDGISWLIAKDEEPYLGASGGLRVDHSSSGYGGGFHVSRLGSSYC
jgi:Fe-S cluster assembly iron-binding protein IscA